MDIPTNNSVRIYSSYMVRNLARKTATQAEGLFCLLAVSFSTSGINRTASLQFITLHGHWHCTSGVIWILPLQSVAVTCTEAYLHFSLYTLYEVSFLHEQWRNFISSPPHPGRMWGPPSHLNKGYRRLLLGVRRSGLEADHSTPSGAEVRNAWNYSSTFPIRLHGVVLNEARGKLYPYLLVNEIDA
jgi:hypothetical protein